MQELSFEQVVWVSGGMSEEMIISMKGGVLGGTEGAVIGGLLTMPYWSMAMSQGSSMLAIFCITAGIGAGSLLGGALGVCAGYGLCCFGCI